MEFSVGDSLAFRSCATHIPCIGFLYLHMQIFCFVIFSFATHVLYDAIFLSIGIPGISRKFVLLLPWHHIYVLLLIPGDTLGSFIYVPCEVMKQRMQVQGSSKSWALNATKGNVSQSPGTQMYGYYNGMFHAGRSILRDHGLKGLYAGYWRSLLLYK
jgi:hypothetical protein